MRVLIDAEIFWRCRVCGKTVFPDDREMADSYTEHPPNCCTMKMTPTFSFVNTDEVSPQYADNLFKTALMANLTGVKND